MDLQVGVASRANAITHAIFELPIILFTIGFGQTPSVVELIILELTRIDVTVSKFIGGKHTDSCDLHVLTELSFVQVPICQLQYADAMLVAMLKVSLSAQNSKKQQWITRKRGQT